MKKILLTAMAALFAVGAVSAQDKGKWALGPQIGVYTNTGADGAIFGVGALARYSFTDRWRIQPAVTFLCKKYCSVDISADMQYLFHPARFWTLYPQVGLSANDIGDWSCGINLGAGTDFNITRNWDISAGFKWMVQTHKYWKNPIIIIATRLAGEGRPSPISVLTQFIRALEGYEGAIWKVGMPENNELVQRVVSPVASRKASASWPYAWSALLSH